MAFMDPALREQLERVVRTTGEVILGKRQQIRLAVACLLARGHLLVEDLPGVGKTTLAHGLARALGLQFSRIQFTSDMLPGDILGVAIFNREDSSFEFHPGPIFSQLILADEVNRATPKTQSALLEAMEEQQVTIEGATRKLPAPFFVIATQNPSYQVGTFPLPESQLDRFMMRIHLGYPDREAERALLRGRDRRDIIEEIEPCMRAEQLLQLQRQVHRVFVSDPLLDYLQELLQYTRESPEFEAGLSPRAGLSLLRAAQSWALLEGRDSVVPEDLQTVLPGVVSHRIAATDQSHRAASRLVEKLIQAVPIP